MLEIKGSNKEVLESVERAREHELLLKRKVSAVLLAQMIQRVEITRIACSPAIYGSLPRSAIGKVMKRGVNFLKILPVEQVDNVLHNRLVAHGDKGLRARKREGAKTRSFTASHHHSLH